MILIMLDILQCQMIYPPCSFQKRLNVHYVDTPRLNLNKCKPNICTTENDLKLI